ncbi:MAG: class I SAM-dependent methyltransferase [Desulfobaccales bacterium]
MKARVNPSYMEQLYSFYSPFYDYVFGKLLEPGRRKAFHYLDRRPHQKILEIGIGPGSTLEKYPSCTHLTGIDISAPMIEEAQKRASQLNGGSTFDLHVMDASQLEFPDNHFDAVISAYVITTVQDPHKVCREILRVVKPEGQIIVINHTRSPNGGFLGKIEDVLAPVCVRIGFTTDLDVIRVMREVGMKVNQAVRCNLMNTGRIIMASKS